MLIEQENYFCYREALSAQFKHGCLEVTQTALHGKEFLSIFFYIFRAGSNKCVLIESANALNKNKVGVMKGEGLLPTLQRTSRYSRTTHSLRSYARCR